MIDGTEMLNGGLFIKPRGIFMFTRLPFLQRSIVRAALCCASVAAAIPSVVHAADWSDTSLSLRYATTFAEPSTTTPMAPARRGCRRRRCRVVVVGLQKRR